MCNKAEESPYFSEKVSQYVSSGQKKEKRYIRLFLCTYKHHVAYICYNTGRSSNPNTSTTTLNNRGPV